MSSTMLPSDSYFAQQHCFPLKGASSLQLHTLVPSHSLLYRASDALDSSVLPFHGQPVGMGSHLFPVGLGPLELCDEVTAALESCTEDQLGSFIVPDGFGLFNGAMDNSTDITLTIPDENAVYCIYSACSIKIRIDEKVQCCFAAGDTSFELTATGKETTNTHFGFEKEYRYTFRAFFVLTGLTLALLASPNWVKANIHSETVLKTLQTSLLLLVIYKLFMCGLIVGMMYVMEIFESQNFISGSYLISAQTCLLPVIRLGYWSYFSAFTYCEFPLSDFLSELGSEAVQSDIMNTPDDASMGTFFSFCAFSLAPIVALIYKSTPFGGFIGHDIADYISLVAQEIFYFYWIYLYCYMIHYIWIRSRDIEEKTCKRAVDRSALALAIVPPLLHIVRCLSMMSVQYFYKGQIYWCWNLLNNGQ